MRTIAWVTGIAGLMTWFYTIHEALPAAARAPSSLLLTPVAIASGLEHLVVGRYPVYDSLPLVFAANWIGWWVLLALAHRAYTRVRRVPG